MHVYRVCMYKVWVRREPKLCIYSISKRLLNDSEFMNCLICVRLYISPISEYVVPNENSYENYSSDLCMCSRYLNKIQLAAFVVKLKCSMNVPLFKANFWFCYCKL